MPPTKEYTKSTAPRSKLKRKRQTAMARAAKLQKREISTDDLSPASSTTTIPASDIQDIQPESLQQGQSASKRKLAFFATNDSPIDSPLPTTYVAIETLQTLFTGLQCASCCSQSLRLQHDDKKNCGLAVYLQVFCSTCEEVKAETFTSPKSDRVHTLNRQAVAASLATGMGYAGLKNFSELMNVPVIHSKTYSQHTKVIFEQTASFSAKLLTESAQIVRKAYPEQVDNANSIIDIDVSYDGTWQTRGHKSKYGVGCIIENRTGLVVDFHVMSKYCHTCSNMGGRLMKINQARYDAWYQDHKSSCDINHYGSSGSMEQQAAVKMWARSLERHGFRYRSVVSDGDTNTIKAIHELDPYEGLTVEKRECVNHVAKRLGTALRNVVEVKKKQKITLGGNGKGKLTQSKIGKLQKYFTKAIRSNSTVPQMRKAIWATYNHCISTDEKPIHGDCPTGAASWCFYQRAASKGLPLGMHEKMSSTYLCPLVAEHIKPVFERMTQDDLLQRCIEGQTQNVNESIHSVIWSRCPKHLFIGRQRLEISVCIGVGEFNMGSKASQDFLTIINLKAGVQTHLLGKKRDSIRICKAQKSLENNEVLRRRLRKKAAEKEMERVELEEGGPQYIPGGADF